MTLPGRGRVHRNRGERSLADTHVLTRLEPRQHGVAQALRGTGVAEALERLVDRVKELLEAQLYLGEARLRVAPALALDA